MSATNGSRPGGLPWRVYLAELVGTAVLLMVGLSFVVLMFGEGSPVVRVLPGEGWRRLITGFLFGTTGALIALSPVGKRSGAPISGTSTNPARSLGPAIVSGRWEGWWICWVGPLVGAVAACVACSALAKRITVAKLYHFDSDRDRLFRRTSPGSP